MQEYVVEVDQGLNQKQLAEHLSVNRTKIDDIAAKAGLAPLHGLYPWRRIFRHIHGTERSSLVAHLETLRVRYGTALPHIGDLETELRAPLLTFEEVAYRLGKKPDTLAKAIRQGRDALPFPTLLLGPRIRRFRPLEVALWIEHEIALDLPPAKQLPAKPASAAATGKTKSAKPTSGSEKPANIASSQEHKTGNEVTTTTPKNDFFTLFGPPKRSVVR